MMQVNTFQFNGATISYRVTGAGPIVVLIHGFGEDGTVWQPQIDFLKNSFTVIIPDLPGSGQSQFIENASIETYAEVIKVMLDIHFKRIPLQVAERTVFIGHSMGGYITLAVAEKYPEYLYSFGLFHSTAFADSEEKITTRRKAIEFIETNGADTFLKLSVPGLFSKAYSEKYPEKITALIESGKNFTDAALIQYYNAMINRPDRSHILNKTDKRVLFIIGENDTAVPLQSSLQQCYLPSQSYVNILSRSAHMGMWEEKEKANEAVFNFLVNKF
jgi:pimeloyl-ACP methyl ester carboxylesterase